MSLKSNRYVQAVDEVVIAQGPPRRHRGFPTGVRLPNGDILVGYRDGSDHHMTHDGAFCITRSSDSGRHWTPSKVLAAFPGWNVCGVMGQYPNGVMSEDEPFLWAFLNCYRWLAEPTDEEDYRTYNTYWTVSHDHGHNWEATFPLYGGLRATVKTDRGEMTLGGLAPHSCSSTLTRLSDGTVMSLFTGNKEIMKYRKHAELRKSGQTGPALTEMPLAGFSKDNLRTWEYVVVADPNDYGIGFSESDHVQLESGRIVAMYGNNQNSPFFFHTCSDDEGRTWSPMKQLDFRGDSPTMIALSDGTLLAAFRHLPEEGPMGIGLVVSADGGETWENLENVRDQGGWDMGYPDLVKLADRRILCIYYTDAEAKMIPAELEAQLYKREPMRTIFGKTIRPRAYEELNGEIRGIFLEDLTRGAGAGGDNRLESDAAKVEL